MLKLIWRLLLFGFTLVVGWSIYRFIIRPSGPFGWDEAAHALKGLLIAHDVKSGDWLSFLFDTYGQVYWPPLHSWLTAIAFLLWPPSTISTRIVSLILFLLTVPVIYIAALQFRQPQKEVAATVATLLFLTSPLIILFSAQAMLEVPGLFFLSLTLLIYIWLNAAPRSPSAHIWLGLAIAATYFTRTNYGVLLIVVVAITTLLDARSGRTPLFSRPNFYTILPIAVAFAVWFAYPPKIASTLKALINEPFGINAYSLEGFLYYPNVVLHLSGSIWQSAVLVIAVIVAFRYWRNPAIRFLIALVIVQFGLGFVHHQRVERHMLPMVPALVLITGFVFAEWWNVQTNAVFRWLPRLATVALCVCAITALPHFLRPLGAAAHPDVVDSIVAIIAPYNSSLCLATKDRGDLSPPLLDWHLCAEKRILTVTHSGVAMHVEEDRKIWQLVQNARLPSALKNELHRVLTRAEQPAKIRSIHLGLPPDASYSTSAPGFAAFLRNMNAVTALDSVVVVTVLNVNSRYPLDFVDGGIRAIGFEHASGHAFAGNNLQLDFYRRTP